MSVQSNGSDSGSDAERRQVPEASLAEAAKAALSAAQESLGEGGDEEARAVSSLSPSLLIYIYIYTHINI